MSRLALFVGLVLGGTIVFCVMNWPLVNYLPPNAPSGIYIINNEPIP